MQSYVKVADAVMLCYVLADAAAYLYPFQTEKSLNPGFFPDCSTREGPGF